MMKLEMLYHRILESISIDSSDFRRILSILEELRSEIVGSNKGNIEIVDILHNKLRRFNLRFEPGQGNPNSYDQQQVGIASASTTVDGLIEFHYLDYFYEISDDNATYDIFIRVIGNLLQHELVHVEQFKKLRQNAGHNAASILAKAKWKHDSERGYLIDKMEIQAFASESISEFLSIGYSKSDIINKLKHINNESVFPSPQESDSFYLYFLNFKEYGQTDDDAKIWRRFVKNMVFFLNDK